VSPLLANDPDALALDSRLLYDGVTAFSHTSLAAGNYGVSFPGAWAKSSLSDAMSDGEATALTDAADSDNMSNTSTFNAPGTISIVDGSGNTLAYVNFNAGDTVGSTMAAFQTAIDRANMGVTATFTAGGGAADSEFGFSANEFGSYADAYEIQITDRVITYDTSSTAATTAVAQTMAGSLVTSSGTMSQVGNRGNTFQNAAETVSITLSDSAMTLPINAVNAVTVQSGDILSSLLAIRDEPLIDSRSLLQHAGDTTALAGEQVQESRLVRDNLQVVHGQLEVEREAVSGVDPNEEIVRLLQFQRSFQAAARIISAIDEVLEQLVQIGD